MKFESDVRELLISNTIRLIAEGGFEAATTKALAHSGGTIPNFNMNEVYIYRLFGSKEKLYEAAFLRLDNELFDAIKSAIDENGGFASKTKDDFYRIFLSIWEFIISQEERCRCYVRYYYSIYFRGNSLEEHEKLFSEIIAGSAVIFKEEADVGAILHSVLTTIMDFSILIHNGSLSDDENNRYHIFNVLYCMMMTYFKEEI